jgi:hypothetical protein
MEGLLKKEQSMREKWEEEMERNKSYLDQLDQKQKEFNNLKRKYK